MANGVLLLVIFNIMNPIVKEHLISAAITFAGTFLTVLGTAIAVVGTAEINTALIGGLLISAVRAALKEVVARFAPLALGGRKG